MKAILNMNTGVIHAQLNDYPDVMGMWCSYVAWQDEPHLVDVGPHADMVTCKKCLASLNGARLRASRKKYSKYLS